jgi:precorrin-2 dehydrogenase/sirohydrochlorin ferrochelatase
MLPLVLDLLEKRVVVFGGRDVGLRKAKYFEDEADVIVVSREFHLGFDSLRVSRIEGEAMEMMKNALSEP